MSLSQAESLALLPEVNRKAILAELTEAQAKELQWDWKFWARPEQLEPQWSWLVWLVLAGRGFGKTRVGAETIRSWVCGSTPLSAGRYKQIALIAETAADAREVMVGDGKMPGEGSGLLQVHPKDFRPIYEPSKRRVTWPNGAIATLYNATEPDQLRGPAHDAAWCDEAAKWQYAEATWDQLQFGLRLGSAPRCVVTTTPRPIKLIRDLLARKDVAVTRGRTADNTKNLAPSFVSTIEARYAGTRLGRQELNAEILEDMPGALWTRELIEPFRLTAPPELTRIVVAIDPAVTSGEDSDEHGIVVAGIDRYDQGFVLADISFRGTPDEACRRAVKAYRNWAADCIVAEANNGGDWIESLLRMADPNLPYRKVNASRGKVTRAEPISSLYEQARVHHVGTFPVLEDQMCSFTPDFDRKTSGYSPDRVDALVWAMTSLFGKGHVAFAAV